MTKHLSPYKQHVLNKVWDKDNTSLLIVGSAGGRLDKTRTLSTIEAYISKDLFELGVDVLAWSRAHRRILSDRLFVSDILIFGRRTFTPRVLSGSLYREPYTLCFLGKTVDLDKNIDSLDLVEAISKSKTY